MSEPSGKDLLALPIGLLGAVFGLLGAWAMVDSASFARTAADFGPENDHLVHDFGAASVAIGLSLLISVRHGSWRTPMLTVAAIWNGLHLISHVTDVGAAASRVVGVAEIAMLVAATASLAALARVSREMS